jgi:cell division ATPase FtsA
MIDDTKEPSEAHQKTLKEEILEQITEKFMEKILDMVNQKVQDALKTPKIKNMRGHRNK